MSRELSNLSPYMKMKALAFLDECRENELDIVIICTDRSYEEQQILFDKKLTNARPGQSAHNARDKNGRPAAEGFDIGVIRHGRYVGNGDDPHYKMAGVIGERLGLRWAGRWTGKLREVAHFQSALFKTPAPIPKEKWYAKAVTAVKKAISSVMK